MSSLPTPTGSPVPKKVRGDEPAPNGTAAVPVVPAASAPKPAPKPQQGKAKRKRNKRYLPDPYSHGDILHRDIADFLGQEYVAEVVARGDEGEWTAPEGLELQTEYELRVGVLGRNGEFGVGSGGVEEEVEMGKESGRARSGVMTSADPR
jgi:tRNA (uracil-5-)-methyltransferase